MLDGGHDLGVYNRTAEKLKPLIGLGAKALDSIKAAATYGEAVFTMLADDAAVIEVASKPGGLVESLPRGGIHICAGTHGIPVIRKIKAAHAENGQTLVAAPMMGRPELVSSGTAGVFASGPADALAKCKPLFDAIGRAVWGWDTTISQSCFMEALLSV